jgi:hypothetical protein
MKRSQMVALINRRIAATDLDNTPLGTLADWILIMAEDAGMAPPFGQWSPEPEDEVVPLDPVSRVSPELLAKLGPGLEVWSEHKATSIELPSGDYLQRRDGRWVLNGTHETSLTDEDVTRSLLRSRK